MKITNEILEGYLNCKNKGHLKLAGESGTKSDYEAMTTAARQASREAALAKLVARFGEGDACRGDRRHRRDAEAGGTAAGGRHP